VTEPTHSALKLETRPCPGPVTLRGPHSHLEPLHAERHTGDLWQAIQGQDEVWDWLFDGPYHSEADLRQTLEEKQAGTGALFLAIVPVDTG